MSAGASERARKISSAVPSSTAAPTTPPRMTPRGQDEAFRDSRRHHALKEFCLRESRGDSGVHGFDVASSLSPARPDDSDPNLSNNDGATSLALEYGLPLAFDATRINPLSVRFGTKADTWAEVGGAFESHGRTHAAPMPRCTSRWKARVSPTVSLRPA